MTKLVLNCRTATVAQLVQAAQAGQRDAFGELFERFQRHVLHIALRRLGDYNEAQELCQDVFVQALQKIGQLRDAGVLRRLAAVDHAPAGDQSDRPPERDLPTEPEELAASCVEDRDAADGGAGRRTGRRRCGTACSGCGELDRATLVAFYVKGQSLAEMSDEFEAPLGTIKRRLHVARKRLAREVEPLCRVTGPPARRTEAANRKPAASVRRGLLSCATDEGPRTKNDREVSQIRPRQAACQSSVSTGMCRNSSSGIRRSTIRPHSSKLRRCPTECQAPTLRSSGINSSN